jgi:cell wall-associated NlpC family hydrolase
MTVLDARLHALRPDLADARLQGQVDAPRFSEGALAWVSAPVADLLRAPRADAALDTQLLAGDAVRVFDERDGYGWVQAESDGYVGYVRLADLAPTVAPATHVVAVPRTFLYCAPDMKLPRRAALSLGSRIAVSGEAQTRGTRYALLASGEAVAAQHLRPLGHQAGDYVAVAETLLRTPYLWGGASAFGIDCAALVQLCLRMAGHRAPRDSDMQAAALGAEIDAGADHEHLRRGDLVFWRGHVAVMSDAETLIHANGHTMDVAHEPLADAVERIGYLYGRPTGFRRP